MNKKTFIFEVHCKNSTETRNVIDWPSEELFRYKDHDHYEDLHNYFAAYLNNVENGPHTQFKADDNNPYSSPAVYEFEEYLYSKQNGIYIQFQVDKGKITDWAWEDEHYEQYKCLEYDNFMIMIEQDIYKSDSIKKIVTSDLVDKYCNKSNTNNNKTENITTKSTPKVNFDILFDYGTLISIGDRFVRKSDISAFVSEKRDNSHSYSTVVVLKSGAKLTFRDIDYDDFVDELDKYYRFKGDIFG